MRTRRQKGRSGGALVLVCISMVAAGVLGTAMLSGLTAARFQRLDFDIGSRALYAAESGRAYVHARRVIEPEYVPAGAYTLASGDRFILSSFVEAASIEVSVTGETHGGQLREAHHSIAFNLALTPEDEDTGSGIDLENVFVYGSELVFRGSTMAGAGGIVIIRGGLTTAQVNMGASLAVSTMYFDGNVNLSSGSTSLGSATEPGDLYINGDLVLGSGRRHIYGDVYVNGNLTLKDAQLYGNAYVNGDVTLQWTPYLALEADSFIYYTGELTHPSNYPQSILDRVIHQETVPVFEIPTDFQPTLHPDAWYASRGYASGGLLVSGLMVFADAYSSTRWRPSVQDVIIVSKGDITITGLGSSGMSGVLIAPYGRVTFNGGWFEGLVLAGEGFHVTSGGTTVTFRNISEFFDSPDDYPVISE